MEQLSNSFIFFVKIHYVCKCSLEGTTEAETLWNVSSEYVCTPVSGLKKKITSPNPLPSFFLFLNFVFSYRDVTCNARNLSLKSVQLLPTAPPRTENNRRAPTEQMVEIWKSGSSELNKTGPGRCQELKPRGLGTYTRLYNKVTGELPHNAMTRAAHCCKSCRFKHEVHGEWIDVPSTPRLAFLVFFVFFFLSLYWENLLLHPRSLVTIFVSSCELLLSAALNWGMRAHTGIASFGRNKCA